MEYYEEIEKSLLEVEQKIAEIKNELSRGADEYSDINYYDILNGLEQTKRTLLRLKAAHKFAKTSKTDFAQLDKHTVIEHTVASYETINTIAHKYNVTVDSILRNNNINSYEIKAGDKLKIIKETDTITNEEQVNYPTFGELKGEEIYGRDIASDFATSDNKDILVLSPIATLKQGILNRITTEQGEYPFEDDFGIGFRIGDEKLTDALLTVKLTYALLSDYRIEDVKNLEVITEGNSKIIKAIVSTINNETIEVTNER